MMGWIGSLGAVALALVSSSALAAADETAHSGPVCAPIQGLHAICGAAGSEDLALVPGGRWLIASGLNLGRPAHLYLIDTRTKTAATLFPLDQRPMRQDHEISPECSGPPDLARMSTDGLGLRPGRGGVHTLYAANHGDRMAIEMFRIDARGLRPRARWIGCAPLPVGTLPNAVAPLPGDGLLVSSFYDPTDKTAWARMGRGENTGRLLEWRPGRGFRPLPGSEMSGANGLETSADATMIYASAWSARKLVIIPRRGGPRREIPLDFMPDNIRRQADGMLMVAGQRTTVESIAACTGAQCPQTWDVVRIDPRSGAVEPLLRRAGTPSVNYACTAMVVGGVLYITARGDGRVIDVPLAELPSLQ